MKIALPVLLAALLLPPTPRSQESRPAEAAAKAGATAAKPAAPAAKIEVVRIPRAARGPQAVVDEDGVVHCVYLRTRGRGEARRGNVFYDSWDSKAGHWTKQIKVTSREMAATRPAIAVADGRAHVVWISRAPRGFWYSRIDLKSGRVEPERDVLPSGARGLELGPVVAADEKGNVYMTWHQGPFKDEDERGVFLLKSSNGGRTFYKAHQISRRSDGACGCCDMATTLGGDGTLYVVFRAAKKKVGRDMMLLTSKNGRSFKTELIDPWHYERCPTATTSVSANSKGDAVVAWETEQKLYWGHAGDFQHRNPIGLQVEGEQSPAIGINDAGETLVAWFTGKGPRSGGVVHWQLFDAKGKATSEKGQQQAAIGSAISIGVRPDGSFALVF